MGYRSLDKKFERCIRELDANIQEKNIDKVFRTCKYWREGLYEYYEFSSGLARGSGVYIPIRDLRKITNYQNEIADKIHEFLKSEVVRYYEMGYNEGKLCPDSDKLQTFNPD